MHRLIGEQAGHRAIAEAMSHMTMEARSSNASMPSGAPRSDAANRERIVDGL